MEKNLTPEAELYTHISENVDMGADAIKMLLPKVKDENLRTLLFQQQSSYLEYSARAASELSRLGSSGQEKGKMKKIPARIGIEMNTLLDDSASHIAELVIGGSDMGIIDMNRALNRLGTATPPEAANLGREVLEFEQRNIDSMKSFL